ncbi:MAG: hypothetical protein HY737_02165 [Candidatus Omnitrophica bacterium]|nr:hypothetical protein [Candidatus Omnitrophota bacterium]
MEELGELVEVEARFGTRGMRPVALVWQGRRRMIRQVTCVWSERDGVLLHRCFAVTDGQTLYELRFDTRALRWQLMKIASEGASA